MIANLPRIRHLVRSTSRTRSRANNQNSARAGFKLTHCAVVEFESVVLLAEAEWKPARHAAAPALAQSDVGIAIGAGTDVAIESAGIVLASDDPRGVVGIRRLSQAGYRKMIQNLVWATGYNVAAIPLAAGALAWAGIVLAPAAAAVLMSASTVIVAINAQLLRRLDLRPT